MIQLRHLRYFVGIVDAGSLSRAATTLYVAQPALSQQMAELEQELGLPLLHRSARGVRPTPAGEVLYREAQAILRHMESCRTSCATVAARWRARSAWACRRRWPRSWPGTSSKPAARRCRAST